MSLSSPRIVTLSAGTATAEITSSRAGDTVYWALRSTAYTNTESIKTGAGGAVDFGNFVSVSGVNSISASSIPLDTNMIFSFFAEPPTIAGADNAILYSNTFNNPAWTLTKTLLDSGQADPLGGTTGWRLKDDNASTAGYCTIEQTASLAAGTYTFSCFVKSEDGENALLKLDGTGDAATNGHKVFDLANQVVAAGGSTAQFNAKVVGAGNGFKRIATSFTTSSTQNVNFEIGIAKANLGFWIAPNGTYSILIYGSQISAGDQLLPYSETTDSPVA